MGSEVQLEDILWLFDRTVIWGKTKTCKTLWIWAIWQERDIWCPDLQVISFSSCIFASLFLCVICTSKNVNWRSVPAFLLAVVALLITADLIMVTVLKPFRQLFVCVKSKD